MSVLTMILGQSGTGKSTSMRNLDPNKVLLIQAVRKALPYRSAEWKPLTSEGGSIYVCDDSKKICDIMRKSSREIIILDDSQYIMSNEFMRRGKEKGYDKFTDIGLNYWNIIDTAASLDDNKRVYILSHTEESETGITKLKTIGKMLDDKITMEGLATIVMQTIVSDGQYAFITRNNGKNTVKTPMGLFGSEYIENDLKAVDDAICEYFSI